jgi:hypothetical protein
MPEGPSTTRPSPHESKPRAQLGELVGGDEVDVRGAGGAEDLVDAERRGRSGLRGRRRCGAIGGEIEGAGGGAVFGGSCGIFEIYVVCVVCVICLKRQVFVITRRGGLGAAGAPLGRSDGDLPGGAGLGLLGEDLLGGGAERLAERALAGGGRLGDGAVQGAMEAEGDLGPGVAGIGPLIDGHAALRDGRDPAEVGGPPRCCLKKDWLDAQLAAAVAVDHAAQLGGVDEAGGDEGRAEGRLAARTGRDLRPLGRRDDVHVEADPRVILEVGEQRLRGVEAVGGAEEEDRGAMAGLRSPARGILQAGEAEGGGDGVDLAAAARALVEEGLEELAIEVTPAGERADDVRGELVERGAVARQGGEELLALGQVDVEEAAELVGGEGVGEEAVELGFGGARGERHGRVRWYGLKDRSCDVTRGSGRRAPARPGSGRSARLRS